MAQQIPDVRVKLSAEGVDEVVRAFQKVAAAGKKAGEESSKGFGSLSGALQKLGGILPALGIATTVVGLEHMVKEALDTAVAIGKMEQKTGLSAETLSVLKVAANQVSVQFDELAPLLAKFNKAMGNLDQGSNEAAASVRRLFGSSKALNGLNTEERFRKVTTAIAQMTAGHLKAKAAQDFFGRGGAELIPLLNRVGNNFDEIKDKAQKMGLIFSEDAVKAATQIRLELKELSEVGQGLAVQFASGLAPALGTVAKSFTQTVTGSGVNGLKTFGEYVGKLIKGVLLLFDTIGQLVATLIALDEEIFDGLKELVTGFLDGVKGAVTGVGDALWKSLHGDTAGAKKALASAKTAIESLGTPALKKLQDHGVRVAAILKSTVDGVTKDFDSLFGDAALEAEAHAGDDTGTGGASSHEATKAQLEATRTRLQDELALFKKQQDNLAAQQKRQYDQGLISLTDYYNKRSDAIRDGGAAEVHELRVERNLLAATPLDVTPADSSDQIAAKNIKRTQDLATLDAKIAQAKVETQGKIDANEEDRRKAEIDFSQKRIELEKQIAVAQGDTYSGAIDAINKQAEELKKQHLPPELIAQIKQLETAAAQLREIERQGNLALGILGLYRSSLDIKVDAGKLFPFEAVQQYDAAVLAALPHLKQLAAARAAAAVTPEEKQAAAQFVQEIERLGVSADQTARRMKEFKAAVESSLTSDVSNFFSSGIDQATGFGDAMRALALSVVDSLRQIAAQMLATLLVQKLLKSLGGLFGGGKDSGDQVASAAAAGVAQAAPLIAAGSVLAAAGGVLTTGGGVLAGASGGLLAGAAAIGIAAIELQAAADTLLVANSIGGAFGFAEGGLVSGPGTGTSDSIPARLSAGEFVMRAASVRQPGILPLLASINRGSSTPMLRSRGVPRFAEGGLVTAGQAMKGGGGSTSEVHIGIEEGLFAKRVRGVMRSHDGQQVQLETLRNNQKRAANALGR